jgi:cyanobactin maturation PatA/PatG family protease
MSNASAFSGLGQGDDRVCIAILDGPVDISHPCFQGADVASTDGQVERNCTEGPALAHGTHVASIIFGQPGSAVTGVAPACRGLFVPIFSDQTHDEHLGCSQLDLARAILAALENGAHIINISGGEQTRSGEPAPILAQAIETCARRNVLIVAAAGNDGCECLHVPAAGRTVLAVGAMDSNGIPLPSSNWGERYRTQGILAPGVDVLGAVPGGGTARKSGTSFAAPFVSGLAGLLASLQIQQGKTPDPHAIGAALLKSATPCLPPASNDCRRFLAGRLNIQAAIEEIAREDDVMTEQAAKGEFDVARLPALNDVVPLSAAADAAIDNATVRMSEISEAIAAPERKVRVPEIRVKAPPAPGAAALGQILPSDCGCGGKCGCEGGQQKPALVFALGQIDYDFGTDARRDTFVQHMPPGANQPFNPRDMVAYLKTNDFKFEAASLIWILKLDETPIYAIQPAGPYAVQGFEFLLQALEGQFNADQPVELVSVPGIIAGSVRLRSGQMVPVIVPRVLGMFAWSSNALAEHVLGKRPEEDAERRVFDAQKVAIVNFIERVYYDLRNLGVTGEERALNFSATNLVQALDVHRRLISDTQKYELDTICVVRSPVCRPDSECYDVKLCFFDPENVMRSDHVIKLTVDVTDTMPVSIGQSRGWSQRDCR